MSQMKVYGVCIGMVIKWYNIRRVLGVGQVPFCKLSPEAATAYFWRDPFIQSVHVDYL